MNNKILVELMVPEIEKTYNIFLPINKRIGNIIQLLNKAISEQEENFIGNNNSLYNRETGKRYDINLLIYDTDIRNGTILILI